MPTGTDEQINRMEQENQEIHERKQELARLQAEHKAAIQADTAALIAGFQEIGILKPCPACGQAQWTGVSMTLHGRKLEDDPGEESGIAGMFVRSLMAQRSKSVLQCLAMTCGNCANMQFFNLEPLMKAAEQAKTDAATATPHLT